MDKKLLITFCFIAIGIISFILFLNLGKNKEHKMYNFVVYTKDAVMKVFGTEYLPFKPGRVFLQLLDNNNQPIDDAICSISFYSPSNSITVEDTLMTHFKRGLYYYDFITPEEEGVYMIYVECRYRFIEIKYNALYYTLKGVTVTNDLAYTFEKDGNTLDVSYGKPNQYIDFTFPYIDSNVSDYYIVINGLVTDVGADTSPKDININVQIYNNCTSTYETLGTLTYYFPSRSFYISDATCYRQPIIRLLSPGGTFTYSIDLLNVKYYNVSSIVINNIRGGGEVHVTRFTAIDIEMPPEISILT